MSDKATKDTDATATEEPTVVVTRQDAADQPSSGALWADRERTGSDEATAPPATEEPAGSQDGEGADARAKVDEALKGVQAGAAAKAADVRERASEAKERTGERAADLKERAGTKAGEAKDKAASLLSSARERTANTDVKEIAASTTSLIDSARPFFLAAFAVVFTILGFVEGDSGTSQLFVIGAILFVLAAGFSDELSTLGARRRRSDD